MIFYESMLFRPSSVFSSSFWCSAKEMNYKVILIALQTSLISGGFNVKMSFCLLFEEGRIQTQSVSAKRFTHQHIYESYRDLGIMLSSDQLGVTNHCSHIF